MGERMGRFTPLVVLLALGCGSPQIDAPDSPETTLRRIRETLERASTVTFDCGLVDPGHRDDAIVFDSCTVTLAGGNRVSMTVRSTDTKNIRLLFRSDGKRMSTYAPGAAVCDWREALPDLVKFLQTCIFHAQIPYMEGMSAAVRFEDLKAKQASTTIAGTKRERVSDSLWLLTYDVYSSPNGKVHLWYEPSGHRLERLRATYTFRGISVIATIENVEFNREVSDSEFTLPPQKQR
jgi:hypothetical protein